MIVSKYKIHLHRNILSSVFKNLFTAHRGQFIKFICWSGGMYYPFCFLCEKNRSFLDHKCGHVLWLITAYIHTSLMHGHTYTYTHIHRHEKYLPSIMSYKDTKSTNQEEDRYFTISKLIISVQQKIP